MRPYLPAVLALCGCGRVGFEARGGVDAGDAMAARLSPCPLPASVPDPVDVTGATFRYTSFDNASAVISDVDVTAQVAGATVAQTRSGVSGNYQLRVPTAGEPVPVVIVAEQTGYYTSSLHSDVPLAAAAAGQRGAVFTYGDLPLWSAAAMSSVYGTAGEPLDSQRGTINVAVRDCDGGSLAGVRVTITPAPRTQFYQDPQGTSTNRSATQAPYTHAIALGAEVGATTISASAPGLEFFDLVVDVRPGTNNTLVVIHAVR